MEPDSEQDVSVNRKALRELLVNSFDYEELNDLCFDYFPEVYERAEGNFGKHVVARLLIDYCQRRGLIRYLLSLIKENNSYQYDLFEDELFKSVPLPSPSPEESKTTLKLIFPHLNLADFTPEKQAALLQLIAEELNIPEEDITILEIQEGSVIITLRLPASAARQLIVLFHAGHPVLQDLRLGNVERIPLKLSLWQRIVKFLTELSGSSHSSLVLFIAAAILLTALAAIPLTVTLRLTASPGATATLISEFVFVTPTFTLSPSPTVVPTMIEAMSTPLPTQMLEPLPTATLTPSNTPTAIPVPSTTEGVTETPTTTPTPTPSNTHTPTPTETFTVTPTPSHTPSPTKTFTLTPTQTPSKTRTLTPTLTPTPGDNQVSVEGPSQVEAGQVFTVAVTIRNIIPPGVYGAQFNLAYQPDHLAIVEITPNTELLVAAKFFDNEEGGMGFAASRREDAPNFTEDVEFVVVTFEAKSVTQKVTTMIELQNVKLGDKDAMYVPASTRSLSLVIKP